MEQSPLGHINPSARSHYPKDSPPQNPDNSEVQFHRLLEKLPAGAYTCDAEGFITYYNQRAVQVWGRSPRLNDSRDRYCGSFKLYAIDGSPIAHDCCWMALALKTNREYNGREIVIERPDGQRVTALAHANPIRDEMGELVGAVNVLVDITERKNMEKALERSQERLRELNHSLEERVQQRTSALLAYQRRLRLLASRLSVAEQTERRRVATDLHDNLAQLLAICKMKVAAAKKEVSGLNENENIAGLVDTLNDALKYTRSLISELSPPFELSRNDLVESVRWVADQLRAHGLIIEIEADGFEQRMGRDTLSTVVASMRELLFNVVRHSGTYTARVSLKRENSRIFVTVSDSGAGFHPTEKHREPDENGGFGLFSIRERLATLGGRLDVYSAPGEGTRAVLSVPVTDQDKRDNGPLSAFAMPRTADMAVQRNETAQIRVLLVDDHEMMREGLRRIIDAEEDMTVVAEASDGETGVRFAHELQPDLVVMDVGLPRMNGIEATKEIVAALPGTRVIALSLNETEEAVDAMRRSGANDYLFKSQAFESLCSAIRKHGAHGRMVRAMS